MKDPDPIDDHIREAIQLESPGMTRNLMQIALDTILDLRRSRDDYKSRLDESRRLWKQFLDTRPISHD